MVSGAYDNGSTSSNVLFVEDDLHSYHWTLDTCTYTSAVDDLVAQPSANSSMDVKSADEACADSCENGAQNDPRCILAKGGSAGTSDDGEDCDGEDEREIANTGFCGGNVLDGLEPDTAG